MDDGLEHFRELTQHAEHLNQIRNADAGGKAFYDLMSGALIWRDETTNQTPVRVIWALRMVWAYRTSIMLSDLRRELRPYWEFGLNNFPRWVGFAPERRIATPELLQIYRRGDVGMRKCLRDLDRDATGK